MTGFVKQYDLPLMPDV
uniref:Uncharacterized protein n=1 Tax=Anguilla anguilla TaxID=7936 RepID=A0A0E9UMP0_ANGAN